MSAIRARNLLFQLSDDDFADLSLKDKVDAFAAARGIDSAMITVDGMLMLYSSNSKLFLNSGVSTLQNWLQLRDPPVRVTEYNNLPRDFLLKYFSNGYDQSKVYYTYGNKFTEHFINFVVKENKGTSLIGKKLLLNEKIRSLSVQQLVENGILSVSEVPRIYQGKQLLERLNRNECLNEDLDGAVTLTFEVYGTDSVTDLPVKVGDFPPVQVTIVGRPAQTHVKKKHYYIYSKIPNFGKSFKLKQLAKQYNIQFVRDPSNWIAVPPRAQFLAFDEVGSAHNKLNFENLKALTGGEAEGFTGNCKSFGDSFTPRADVQVIMLSNNSPYDMYGTWNATLQRRVMTVEDMQQFDERFKVFRLDGSVEEDRIKALEPGTWNDDQFLAECKSIVDRTYAILTTGLPIRKNVIAIEETLDDVVKLCGQRKSGNNGLGVQLVHTVLKDLDNGRFCPTLVATFDTLYEGVLRPTKVKGLRLEAARKKLIGQVTADETVVFRSMQLDEVTRHVVENPTAVYRLYRFYADVPHCIDFTKKDDKEQVYRDCVKVHGATDDLDEWPYRSRVFDQVWNVACRELEDGKNEEGQNTSEKRKRRS